MRITASADIDRLESLDEVKRYVAIFLGQVVEAFNNNLSIADNLSAKTLTVTFSAANVTVASLHGLGREPSGYFLVGSTAAMSIYDGTSANTSSVLYLRASAPGIARVVVY